MGQSVARLGSNSISLPNPRESAAGGREVAEHLLRPGGLFVWHGFLLSWVRACSCGASRGWAPAVLEDGEALHHLRDRLIHVFTHVIHRDVSGTVYDEQLLGTVGQLVGLIAEYLRVRLRRGALYLRLPDRLHPAAVEA